MSILRPSEGLNQPTTVKTVVATFTTRPIKIALSSKIRSLMATPSETKSAESSVKVVCVVESTLPDETTVPASAMSVETKSCILA